MIKEIVNNPIKFEKFRPFLYAVWPEHLAATYNNENLLNA